ncbi:MAG: hypothetical protein M1832_001961 [Thelocarpon impressellum]|nr:MAG: hypothetical protein M1832_001961 [Thelocarpon impressellum]
MAPEFALDALPRPVIVLPPNSAKAMADLERKLSQLPRKTVKFQTYIDCRSAAQVHKERIYAERTNIGADHGQVVAET